METVSIPTCIVRDLVVRLDSQINRVYDEIIDGGDPDYIYKILEEMKSTLVRFPIIDLEISDFPEP
jgi:hypothetical protein